MKNHISNAFKCFFTLMTVVTMSCVMPFTTIAAVSDADDIFYDDFTGLRLDMNKWLIAEKNWGGTVTENGETVDYNGGVVSENVAVRDGDLVFTGLGDLYEGEQKGINRDGSRRLDGKRCGGAIATREYYASGSYEIRAKIAPVLGCCSAMWTFEYEEDYSGDDVKITNHEIDIEFPGRDDDDDFSLSHALCTTWITEEDYKTKSVNCGDQADGEFHTYRFDWHTGSDTETPRVEYYFDDVLTYTSYDYIPTNESRFWLGLWFPKYWAGTPDFDTTEFVIDYVKITPFHESGDTQQHESYPDSGWANPDAELPKGWLLWHSYSEYAALDSKLYLRTPDGSTKEIGGDFIHAMNGSFGIAPERIAFMAIDSSADEWDIYLYDNGNITNLTKNSGFRNEDPKWSPDGKQIVFKRGYWDNSTGDFVYNLATLNINTYEVTMLTNDRAEEAMPFFSEDGKYIYYTRYTDGIGSICRMDVATHETEDIYSEADVTAYYPITQGEQLYFAKWYSAENHFDQLMCYDGSDISVLPFNSEQYDCSDSCPVMDDEMIYSSTANGGYDLYYYDGRKSVRLTELCSDKNELGADYYSLEEYEDYLDSSRIMGDVNCDGEFTIADVVLLQKWLLAVPNTELADWKAGDLCEDDRLDVFDLCLMKRLLLQSMGHNPLDSLIGMNYEDAVRNSYISRLEYNYQIAGRLKSTIEDKMGRPLDYSIDRFYLVNNEKLGLNSDTKYLYNATTMDIYVVHEETKMNCATWYWKGSKAALYGIDDDNEKQNEFLDAMEFYGITEIYYSIGANKLIKNKDMVESFVKNAYTRDIKVYLLTGEKTWLYEDSYQTAIYTIFDKVEEYNSLVDYDARLAGVSYDVEVWANSEFNWKNNDAARYQQIKFIETAQKYAESKNLSVIHCLPFWIVQYDYTDDEGVTRNVYDSITQIANDTILMVYRDSASAVERLVTEVQNNAENSVFYYIEKNDCNLEIAVQAAEPTEGDYVTFYEEEKENPGYVTAEIATIKSDLEMYQYRTTFAIHHAIALYEYYLSMEG